MSARNSGLVCEPLFVAATRPPMRWGVTYPALLCNLVFTMEVFLFSRHLLTLLVAAPVHGVQALLCARDARCFELLGLWARTRIPALLGNQRYWKASSCSPLSLRDTWVRRAPSGRREPPSIYVAVAGPWHS